MRLLFCFFILSLCAEAGATYPQVEIKTSQGPIWVELYPDKAPKTVENFLKYVKSGFYKGTIFHRVVNHFVIQGGGFTTELKPKDTLPAIPSEATNGLRNDAGMLAMARAYDPNSATSQFFINVERNLFLNHHTPHPDYYGYTVFGKVIQGMDIVEKIAATPTTTAGPFFTDVPVTNIVIEDMAVVPDLIVEPTAEKKSRSKHKKNTKK
jgi:cyclophilin family peptidyl-prolyl cis-trans isomerase